jgi:hypothetical protein
MKKCRKKGPDTVLTPFLRTAPINAQELVRREEMAVTAVSIGGLTSVELVDF